MKTVMGEPGMLQEKKKVSYRWAVEALGTRINVVSSVYGDSVRMCEKGAGTDCRWKQKRKQGSRKSSLKEGK